MPHIETTPDDFNYDEELLGELLLVFQGALRVTGDKPSAQAVLRSYADIKIAKFHAAEAQSEVDLWYPPEKS